MVWCISQVLKNDVLCMYLFVQFNKTMPPLSVPIKSKWFRAKTSRLDSPEFFRISVDFSLLVTCGESAEVPCRMLILQQNFVLVEE